MTFETLFEAMTKGGTRVRYYTGIGSRKTPHLIQLVQMELAKDLGKKGFILRSGYADGSDLAFTNAACEGEYTHQNWLPWPGFNGSTGAKGEAHFPKDHHFEIASLIHPAWSKLKDSVRKLHARNVGQILGGTFDVDAVKRAMQRTDKSGLPDHISEFVVCWTEGGAESHLKVSAKTGGTGTAIKLASILGIPVFNLADDTAKARLDQWVER